MEFVEQIVGGKASRRGQCDAPQDCVDLLGRRAMQAFDEAPHRFAAFELTREDFLHVGHRHAAVEHRVGIDEHVRALIARAETARIRDRDGIGRLAFLLFRPECLQQRGRALAACADDARMLRRPVLVASKHMSFWSGHDDVRQPNLNRMP
ncbi:hypothetical protein [Paraburkholderia sp. BL9I2N2]|uniref:hypothetical protein n=1 Tax=Paraburkholderia sp. BL9I2N2 TaxID=1938809 RepID=UPI001FB26640|nr:hypothetical protein [Paraburkholderia sp. BL9I2N2]